MKAQDLMIGDWVMCNNKTYRIAEIGGMVHLVRGKKELLASLDEIKPVSLTPEILEKNGFKLSPCSRNYYNEITIEVLYGKYERCEYDGILRIPKDWKIILFVHRFQHALRLCGIDKEITL